MLWGSARATVDGKGRLKIPAAFKPYMDENGAEFYVTSLDGQSVRIYPLSQWREIEEKVKAKPSMDKSVKKFLARTNYFGQMGRADSQGRLLIPSVLRESAAMHGEVVVFDNLKYLAVWNDQRFRAHLESEPLTEEDEKELSGYGI
ncbi:MAG: division/cell wall cluster transcriptional repressor MraZ [Terriglobia bacterium]|jgi:MraZ protein